MNPEKPESTALITGTAIQAVCLVALFVPGILSPLLQLIFPHADEWLFPRASLFSLTITHLWLAVAASIISTSVGIVLGIICTRDWGREFQPLIRDASALAQTLPPAAVVALAISFFGFGFEPILLALILYSLLPVVNNTISGLENLPRSVLDAARGMGMGKMQVLLSIEMPLALPLIGSGIRSNMVINVGTATLSAFAGVSGLGSPIVAGLTRNNPAWVFQGALTSALLALFLNSLLLLLERRLVTYSVGGDLSWRAG